jgi:plasmid maintenance system antidote protein VapI
MNKLHFTPVHPGDVLQDELEEIGLTQSGLAKHIGVLPKTINGFGRKSSILVKPTKQLGAQPAK